MEENTSVNGFIKFLSIVFILFLITYMSKENGYYDFKAYQKMKLTTESIMKFEKDLEEGKDVTKNDYKVTNYVDYTNRATNIGYKIGKFIERVMNEGIKKSLKILSELFYE